MVARPDLRNKPIGITQKYLVVTTNYPARRAGVQKMSSIREAKSICPDIILIPGERLDQFRNASREILKLTKAHMLKEIEHISQHSGTVTVPIEKSGLDEIYLDLTQLCLADSGGGGSSIDSNGSNDDNTRPPYHCIGTPDTRQTKVMYHRAHLICQRLRSALKQELGYECCGGISNSKMTAKIAVNEHKPNDQTTLLPDAVLSCLLHRPLHHLTGIGRRMSQCLLQALPTPILTVKDALGTSFRVLEELLCKGLQSNVVGKNSATLVYLMCRGIDCTAVVDKGPTNIISVEDSMRNCTSLNDVQEYLIRMSNDLIIRIDEHRDEHQRIPTKLHLKIRFNGGYREGHKFTTAGCTMPHDAVMKRTTTTATSLDDPAHLIASSLLTLFKKQLLLHGGTSNRNAFVVTGMGCSARGFQELKELEGQQDLRGMMMHIKNKQASPGVVGSGGGKSIPAAGSLPPVLFSSTSGTTSASSVPSTLSNKRPHPGAVVNWTEVDASVLAALPKHIQMELQQAYKPSKKKPKKTTSIRSFFGKK